MARPSVTHDGFLIPNASGVAEPVLAEPDQIDFNTLANARWGVIEGCQVNSQGAKSVMVSDGTAIVNGTLVRVTSNQIPLPTPGANAQFVLIVVNSAGVLGTVEGSPSTDPVFPDPGANQTVLASVYCDATSGTFANNIVDKRKMLPPALLTKVDPAADLIRNINNTGTHFLTSGNGAMTWEGDTKLYRLSAGTLKAEDDLVVGDQLTVNGNSVVHGNETVDGVISSRNFRRGTVLPGSATNGDMFVQTNTANVYLWLDGAWIQLATMSATQGVVPIGTVIFSLQTAAVMRGLGWYPMNGTEQLTEAQHAAIFNIAVGGTVTGTSPNRTMTLPNLNRRTMIVDFAAPHAMGGVNANNKLTLTKAQLPKHNHNVGGTNNRTSTTGKHKHVVGIDANSGAHSNHVVTGGTHDHPVYDPGHRHESMDWYGQAAPIIAWVEFPGSTVDGKNKIDALFNDHSHTYTVEPIRWTMKGLTGIDIGPNQAHGHGITGGGHDHTVSCDEVGDHFHTVSEADVGEGTAIDITPLNYTIYAYIRA